MSRYSEHHMAVGTTHPEPGKEVGVIIHMGGLGSIVINEPGARKLADDILRNANFLWPIENKEAP